MKIGQFDKAEELYNVLLEQTSDEGEKALYYNQLGYIQNYQGEYEKPIEYHKKSTWNLQKNSFFKSSFLVCFLKKHRLGVLPHEKLLESTFVFWKKTWNFEINDDKGVNVIHTKLKIVRIASDCRYIRIE